jgi:hypothetical protein
MASYTASTRQRKREVAICKGDGSPVSTEESNIALVHEFLEALV